MLAEIFTPIIPAIIVGGLILGFRNILDAVPFEFLGQKVVDGVRQVDSSGHPIWNTLVDVSTFWSGVDSFYGYQVKLYFISYQLVLYGL